MDGPEKYHHHVFIPHLKCFLNKKIAHARKSISKESGKVNMGVKYK
jgi:hypothetical protein